MPLDRPNLDKLSRAMSLILRHNSGGKLHIDRYGYADVTQVCSVLTSFSRFDGAEVTPDMLAEAAADPSKKRFGLSEDGRRIRALSGHSFSVDLGLEPFVPSGDLYFGTSRNALDRILTDGFLGSSKLKVRLLDKPDLALAVARTREGEPLVIAVDACRLHGSGWSFGRSESGEILTDRFGGEYCSEFSDHSPAP